MNIQIYEAQEIPNIKCPKQSASRHIVKLSKVKGKNIFKKLFCDNSKRKTLIMCNDVPIKVLADFSA